MADIPTNPVTRQEQYLNAIAGGAGEIPDEPVTRVEQYLAAILESGGGGGGGGTTNYNALSNKPQINGVELRGNKTAAELGITGGSAELTEDMSVSKAVGGIASGKSYAAGTSLETILNEMLSPTVNPTLTPPSASVSYDVPGILPVGQVVDAKTATVTLNRGSINPKYTADEPYRAGAATGYSLKVDGEASILNDSNTTGQFNVPSYTRNTKGDVTLTATASHGQGCQPKNSAGGNYSTPLAAGSVSATKKVTFILPFMYGSSDTKELTSLDGLTTDVTVKENKEYAFTTNNEYSVIAYDTDYGDIRQIKDQNGFDTTSGWEKHILGTYTYYVTKSRTTDTGAKSTFTF